MITSKDCLKKYGAPELEANMVLWDVPSLYEIGVIPKKIYCNRDTIAPLTIAFVNLIATGRVNELKTWDGCFNIRQKRGGSSPSLHSWGVAVDVNSLDNKMGEPSTLSPEFVKCWTDAGFDWGGGWLHKDSMHFQLSKLP